MLLENLPDIPVLGEEEKEETKKKERQNSDTKARQETTRQDKRHQIRQTRDTKARQDTSRDTKTRQETQKQDKTITSYQARLHLSDFATATDVRLKWTLTLKAREDRQSTRQLGGHGGEVHSRVNAVVDEADAAERHFAYNRRQDKIKQDNRKTRQDKTRQSQDKTTPR